SKAGEPLMWPRHQQADVIGQIRVADLEDRARAAVIKAGIAADATVGMPVSLHFARKLDPDSLAKIGCRLFERNRNVPGVLLRYQEPEQPEGSAHAPSVVNGLCVFVPLEPLLPGKGFEVRWEVPEELRKKDQPLAIGAFTVR